MQNGPQGGPREEMQVPPLLPPQPHPPESESQQEAVWGRSRPGPEQVHPWTPLTLSDLWPCTLSGFLRGLVETALNDNSAFVSPEGEPLPGCRDEAGGEGTEMGAHFLSITSSYPGGTMGGRPALTVPGEEAGSCMGGRHTRHRGHGTLPGARRADLRSCIRNVLCPRGRCWA